MVDNSKFLLATAGIAGAAGAALFMQATPVSAASATVTYSQGATTVWKSPAFGQAARYVTFKQTVNILGSKQVGGNTWYQIGQNEWIPGVYLKLNQSGTTATPAPTPSQPQKPVAQAPSATTQLKVTYSGGAVTVWATASYSKGTGQYLTTGQTVSAVSAQTSGGETWYKLANGGFVPSRFVQKVSGATQPAAPAQPSTPAPSTPTQPSTPAKPSTPAQPSTPGNGIAQAPSNQTAIQKVIALAKQQLGKPYVWGGKGPSAFDCSGLMQYVFQNAAGINIGGWTVPQESAGTKVAINALKPGDLVFWGDAGNTYHVGLYLGGGQFLNAPKPGENVQINALSPYWAPSFGVRVL